MNTYNLLDDIHNPDDLKKLSEQELPVFCEEMRQFLIESVLSTGGHLSSNLGVVELMVALHYVFNFVDNDTLVLDVSHQCYPHKILTGRRQQFDTLRQYGGLCGYTNPKESNADSFLFGHAGTSISTSLGIRIGQSLQNIDGHVVAFIGDASVSCGVALEALNHAGHLNTNLIVILNDNCMSISKSVGSLSTYLSKLRLNSTYQQFRQKTTHLFSKIPWIGKHVLRCFDATMNKIKPLIAQQGAFFQALNFNYYGPLDGHNVIDLVKQFRAMKSKKGPLLIHVSTEKGKGYAKAASDPIKYHGVSGTNHSQQQQHVPKAKIKFTDAFSYSLMEYAKQDESIVAITASMPLGTGLSPFLNEFPKRYFDVGICEQHAIAMSAGLSKAGLKPICCIYSTFLQRAYDQVFQEICLNRRHVIFALDRSGIVGPDGATHAGLFDIAYLRTLPNMILMSPINSFELKKMLYFALYQCQQPVAIRYPRDDCFSPWDESLFEPIELGRMQHIKTGDHLVVVVYGSLLQEAFKAVKAIELKHNIRIELVNARFAKPISEIDVKTIYAKEVPIFIIEDHSIQGGFGSAMLEVASKLSLNTANTHLLGISDSFVPQGKRAEILSLYDLDADGITRFIQSRLHF